MWHDINADHAIGHVHTMQEAAAAVVMMHGATRPAPGLRPPRPRRCCATEPRGASPPGLGTRTCITASSGGAGPPPHTATSTTTTTTNHHADAATSTQTAVATPPLAHFGSVSLRTESFQLVRRNTTPSLRHSSSSPACRSRRALPSTAVSPAAAAAAPSPLEPSEGVAEAWTRQQEACRSSRAAAHGRTQERGGGWRRRGLRPCMPACSADMRGRERSAAASAATLLPPCRMHGCSWQEAGCACVCVQSCYRFCYQKREGVTEEQGGQQ